MDNLADILGRKDFDEPAEIAIIKRYVYEHFGVEVAVRVQPKVIIIYARSAPLVNSLRLQTWQLQRACQTEKKFVFRIGTPN